MAHSVEKEQAVSRWLKDVFDDEPVPKFTKSPSFTDQLFQLMMKHKSSEKTVEVYREFCAACKEHFTIDGEEASALLDHVGLKSTLPDYFSTESEHLCKLADSLSLSNTDHSSYVLGLLELNLKKEKTVSEFDLYKRCIDAKESELTQTVNNVKRLENMAGREQAKETDVTKTLVTMKNETTFLNQKILKYKSDKSGFDRKLDSSLLRTNLTHDKLVESHDELKSLQSKLDQTREQLDMYASLPPDRKLAAVKLAVAKAELQELEDKLVKQCDMFHL